MVKKRRERGMKKSGGTERNERQGGKERERERERKKIRERGNE